MTMVRVTGMGDGDVGKLYEFFSFACEVAETTRPEMWETLGSPELGRFVVKITTEEGEKEAYVFCRFQNSWDIGFPEEYIERFKEACEMAGLDGEMGEHMGSSGLNEAELERIQEKLK